MQMFYSFLRDADRLFKHETDGYEYRLQGSENGDNELHKFLHGTRAHANTSPFELFIRTICLMVYIINRYKGRYEETQNLKHFRQLSFVFDEDNKFVLFGATYSSILSAALQMHQGRREAYEQFLILLTNMKSHGAFRDYLEVQQREIRNHNPGVGETELILTALRRAELRFRVTKDQMCNTYTPPLQKKDRGYPPTNSNHQQDGGGHSSDEEEYGNEQEEQKERTELPHGAQRMLGYNERIMLPTQNLYGHEDPTKCGHCLRPLNEHPRQHNGEDNLICDHIHRVYATGKGGLNVDLIIAKLVNKQNGAMAFHNFIKDNMQVGLLRTYSQAEIDLFHANATERINKYVQNGYAWPQPGNRPMDGRGRGSGRNGGRFNNQVGRTNDRRGGPMWQGQPQRTEIRTTNIAQGQNQSNRTANGGATVDKNPAADRT